MRIQSIGIFANPNNEGALAAVSSVYGVARSRGVKCFIDRSFANMEEFIGYETIQEQVPGLMIAIGGDGTILHAAGYAAEHDIPILGINFGRIGFLSEIDVEGISDALDAIESEQYRTDKCMMLSCSVNGCAAKDCLNEAVLYRKKFSRRSIDYCKCERHRCWNCLLRRPYSSYADRLYGLFHLSRRSGNRSEHRCCDNQPNMPSYLGLQAYNCARGFHNRAFHKTGGFPGNGRRIHGAHSARGHGKNMQKPAQRALYKARRSESLFTHTK